MKNIVLSVFMILNLVGFFHAFGSLESTTYIEPNKSFVLGEGRHGSYKANIINKGKVNVEGFSEQLENEKRESLGVLKPNDRNHYEIPENTKVIFKNLGDKTAVIGISLTGETGLSMDYKDNRTE